MSRHVWAHGEKTIVVGYDPPLRTFFGQVWDHPDDDDLAIWVGCVPEELTSVEALETKLGFALPPELRSDLIKDKKAAPEPSPLQKLMCKKIDELFGPGYNETNNN